MNDSSEHPEVDEGREKEKRRERISVLIPLFFVIILWVIFLTEWVTGLNFRWLGVYPRSWQGLSGILFAPLMHGDFSHLISNSVPVLILGSAMIYFYRSITYKVLPAIWICDGIGVWLLGREAWHIGASGLVYGMASFLFFSGLLRRNRRLTALSLAVVFLYGGIIWGMFPFMPDISWESHLFGFVSGIFLSIYYLRKGPADDPVPEWMNEMEGDENEKLKMETGSPPEAQPDPLKTNDQK